MDIRSLPAVLQGATSPSAAVPNVSPSVRNILTNIATSPSLSDSQRSTLIAATATASQIADVNIAEIALETVNSTGIYLRNTGGSSSPRWQVLTALRAYGLNLTEQPAAPAPKPTDAALASQVQATLSALVQQAKANNAQAAPVQPPAPVAAPVVQALVQATVQATPPQAPAPAPSKPAAPAVSAKLDTLV